MTEHVTQHVTHDDVMHDDVMHDDVTPAGGIVVAEHDDHTLIRMHGEIDGNLRGQASAAMAQCLVRGLPVTVDVGGVTFIDSSGIAFLLQLHRAGTEDGIAITLLDPPALVLDLFEMIGMAGELPLAWTPARPAGDGADTDAAPGGDPQDGRAEPRGVIEPDGAPDGELTRV